MDLSLPQRSPERLPPPARIGAELGGGVLGLLSGGLVGGGGGFLVALLGCSASLDGGLCDVATLVYGTALGAGAGTSLGVHLGGKAAGGNGTGWAAAGGVTLGLAALLFAAPEGQQQRLLPYALALPVLGVLGYELTDRAPEAGSVTPSLALGPQGGSLALSGRF